MRNLRRILSLMIMSTLPMAASTTKSDFYSISPPQKDVLEERELICLAKNLYFEARGEPLVGQIAVAQVTINRKNSSRYPNTICGVVYQAKVDSNGNPLRDQCQFHWYCDGKSDKIENWAKYNSMYQLAEKLLTIDMLDVTEGAMYYHSNSYEPRWTIGLNKTVTIEGHKFYKRS